METQSTHEPIVRLSTRRRTLVVGIAVTLAFSMAAAATAVFVTDRARIDNAARSVAAVETAELASLNSASDSADAIVAALAQILDALEDTEIDTTDVEKALKELGSGLDTRDTILAARGAGIAAANAAIRATVAYGTNTATNATLAGAVSQKTLTEALAALRGAPQGLPGNYANTGKLIAAVLKASGTVTTAHTAAGGTAPPPPAGQPNADGTTPTTPRTGGNSGGGGGQPAVPPPPPPPPPPPHPRAALCESLGFAGNGACLDNQPTYVQTNSFYVPLASCVDPGAYGSHTPGFGGTSVVNYQFPWSYQINYASSGLGSIQFYVCG